MRFYTVLASRPQYYDRAPTDQLNQYATATGPHGSTARWTYTVPAARKAFVEYVQVSMWRETVAAPVGDAYCQITHNTNLVVAAELNNNTVGSSDKVFASSYGLLQAGDVLSGITTDLSTGGTIQYVVVGKATEFTA